MKKVSKAILIGLAVVLVLIGALVVGLNMYIQSPGVQARIQEELSEALRLPLKITNTSVTPWSDLRISGISIPYGGANFLEATSFTASYRRLPLLEGKLIITEMRVENPKIVWTQDAKGKWKMPEPEEAAAAAREDREKAPEPPEAPAIPGVALTEPPAAPEKVATVEKKHPAKKKGFAVIINRVEVKDGMVELLDEEHQPVASLIGVNMLYTKLTGDQVEGTASIDKAVWSGGLTLESVRTPFIYTRASREFRAPEITATLGGGTLRGNYQSRVEEKRRPFNAALEFERISIDQLVTEGGGAAGQATGELRGKVDIRGETNRMEKAQGQGVLDLRDGQFRQLDLFQNIGHVLGLRELSNLRLKEGHAELRLRGDKVDVERLLLTTSDLQLSSKGTLHLNKKVELDAQLSVDETLVRQLPDMVRDSFAMAENNRRTIDFTVTGTTEKLKTNLLDKLVGQKINAQFGDLLGSLFGGDKKAEEEKKKKEQEERKKAEKKKKKEQEQNKEKGAASGDGAPVVAGIAQSPAPASHP